MKVFSRALSSILVGILVCVLMCGTVEQEVQAANDEVTIDGSLLTEEDSSEGQLEYLPWGTYLKSGWSSITDAGNGKLSAGGNTVGQRVVSSIKIYVRVQKLIGSSWTSYTSWSASETNSAYVSTSKTMSVDRGYYYRVYSTHVAGGDTSSSSTNGIYID